MFESVAGLPPPAPYHAALTTFFGVPIGNFGFVGESAPIDDDLTFKALIRELRAGTIRPEVLRALIDLTRVPLAHGGADPRRGHRRPPPPHPARRQRLTDKRSRNEALSLDDHAAA